MLRFARDLFRISGQGNLGDVHVVGHKRDLVCAYYSLVSEIMNFKIFLVLTGRSCFYRANMVRGFADKSKAQRYQEHYRVVLICNDAYDFLDLRPCCYGPRRGQGGGILLGTVSSLKIADHYREICLI